MLVSMAVCSAVSMAHRTTGGEAHVPVLVSTSAPAQNVRPLSLASATSPWRGASQPADVVVGQVGRLPRPDVRHKAVEASAVPHLRRRELRQPSAVSTPLRQVRRAQGCAGDSRVVLRETPERRRSFPAEADIEEVGAVLEWSLAADEEIGVVGRTGASQR